MVARKASSQRLSSVTGAFLLALGFVLLFANLDGIAASLNSFAGVPASEAVCVLPALGLAGMHAVQAYNFDHDAFLSGLRQILISFWPMFLVAIGAVLLQRAFGARLAKSRVGSAVSAAWGRHERR